MTQDVFTSETPETKTETPVKTAEDRLKDKDDFIDQLKAELKAMREELHNKIDAEKALDDLRNEMKSLKESRQPTGKDATTSALSEVDIKSLVQKTITETESSRTKEQNVKQANDALVTHFQGDTKRASEEVQKRAKELNVSVQFLKDAAAQSPTAFIEVMGIKRDKVEDNTSFVQSTVNSDALSKENKVVLKEGTKAYFDNIRKTDPKRYYTPEVWNQLWKAAKAGTYQ